MNIINYMKKLASEPRLTAEQVAHYQEEGYLIYPDPVLPQQKFDRLKAHFDKKLEALPQGRRPEAMDVPHFADPALFEWLLADEILDLVEPILGPDIALFSSHFICKPKGDGRKVPWHEDSAYWRKVLEPMEVCTVWLAIDPSTLANGCMKVIPRTHNSGRKGFSDYDAVNAEENVFSTEIKRSQRRDELAVPCELQANHASLHDARLMHGSAANTSEMRRCGYTMRFMRSSTILSEEARRYHQVYMARGKDLSKGRNRYADPTIDYSDFLDSRVRQGRSGH